MVNGSGAWEIYLDGPLLGRDGTVDPDPTRVQPNPNETEPLELPGTGRGAHVLAVRFAPYQYPLLQKLLNESPPFSTRLQGGTQLRKATAERAAVRTIYLVVRAWSGCSCRCTWPSSITIRLGAPICTSLSTRAR